MDGFDLSKTSCSGTIFSGGASDGFAYINIPCIGIYFGGSNDGFASNVISCPASSAIFSGGSSDGFALTSLISCLASANVFKGGSSDGFGILSISCPVPNNIFTGSSYQGFAFNSQVCSSPVNIFTGGANDGFSMNNITCLVPINIFYGGSYQGFSIFKIACASTIYSGGSNDGFATGSIACSGIFFGGSYDGFSVNSIACLAASNVSMGGSYDGFVFNNISCPSPTNIFSGFSYDGFSLAREGCSYVVPIEMVFFKAHCENKKVFVNWETASQFNNNYFTIERSGDGVNFYTIGIVQGAGNSTQELNYTFIDAAPPEATSYYRLRQTDFDGQSEYFDAVTSTCRENSGSLSIYPNPNNGHFFIEGPSFNANLVITNLVGEKVYESKIKQVKTEITLDNQPNGIYFIHVTMENGIVTKKIFIAH